MVIASNWFLDDSNILGISKAVSNNSNLGRDIVRIEAAFDLASHKQEKKTSLECSMRI